MIHGADVSAFQLAPAHWTPEAGAIAWAGVKASELGASGSRYVAPTLAEDASWLAAHGLGRIFYAYGHPASLPSATVALLAEAVHPYLEDGDGIALDLEVNDGLSVAEVAAYARATTAAMRVTFGRTPLAYSDLSFIEDGNLAGCGWCSLWIADISRPAGQPRIPAPWNTYLVHQYSWAPLDRDVARVTDLAAFRAAVGKPAPKPPEGKTVSAVSDGTKSLQAIAAAHKTSPAYILHLTAKASAAWPVPVHDWLQEVLTGKRPATGPVPKGCVFQVPAP